MEIKDIERENRERETKLRILEFKSEVYDMIRRQEMLTLENNNIQEAKIKLVQEIQKLEELN